MSAAFSLGVPSSRGLAGWLEIHLDWENPSQAAFDGWDTIEDHSECVLPGRALFSASILVNGNQQRHIASTEPRPYIGKLNNNRSVSVCREQVLIV